MITAVPMTLGDYNTFKGWTIPKDEDPNKEGFKVKYSDDYISWSPKEAFIESYKPITDLSFGLAIESFKKGFRIARRGWNGKDMCVIYQKGYPNGIMCNKQTAEAWGLTTGELFRVEPYLQIQMANGSHSMWTPSINDCLADDWYIVE